MKKDFVIIFLVTVTFLLPVFSLCNAAPAPPPDEYVLQNTYQGSLDLSNNGQNEETVIDWFLIGNDSKVIGSSDTEPEEGGNPAKVHGVIYSEKPYIIRNNGQTNLTNVTVISYWDHTIYEVVPVLEPNETFSINRYPPFEIFSEQRVYAKFYSGPAPDQGTIVITVINWHLILLFVFVICMALLSVTYYNKRDKNKPDNADIYFRGYIIGFLILFIPFLISDLVINNTESSFPLGPHYIITTILFGIIGFFSYILYKTKFNN